MASGLAEVLAKPGELLDRTGPRPEGILGLHRTWGNGFPVLPGSGSGSARLVEPGSDSVRLVEPGSGPACLNAPQERAP